jgi:hypothetical protein
MEVIGDRCYDQMWKELIKIMRYGVFLVIFVLKFSYLEMDFLSTPQFVFIIFKVPEMSIYAHYENNPRFSKYDSFIFILIILFREYICSE